MVKAASNDRKLDNRKAKFAHIEQNMFLFAKTSLFQPIIS